MSAPGRPTQFILTAFDRVSWCPVLEACFVLDDWEPLRSILRVDSHDDHDLRRVYTLDAGELDAVIAQFNVAFDPNQLGLPDVEVWLARRAGIPTAPYLIHTGYELPLLLEGRKKLARMSHTYPPLVFKGEDRFDAWVRDGLLHKEVDIEPFGRLIRTWLGHRTVYYTLKGEEWRIPAMKLLRQASGQSGGWNEYHERLEGMLFGYENWQNDWWINQGISGGGFGGASFCTAINQEQLRWIENAGYRALPPPTGIALNVIDGRSDDANALHDFMSLRADSVALVRFNVLGRHVMNTIDLRGGGPWDIPALQVPELNRHLRGLLEIIARRGDQC